MHWIAHSLVAAAAYLLGSIPTGFLVGRAKGIDIRKVGSGNIGATNAFRILGKGAGALVLLADAAKGFLACTLLVRAGVHFLLPVGADTAGNTESLTIVAGITAILGHNYTCWLRFKGGKGVATTAGVLLALFPWAFLLCLGLWSLVLLISRYVSLASIAAALALPWAVWLCGGDRPLIIVAALLGALAIFKHKGNIQRLVRGTESRLGRKKPDATAPLAGAGPGTGATSESLKS